jgi:hypothetical protein
MLGLSCELKQSKLAESEKFLAACRAATRSMWSLIKLREMAKTAKLKSRLGSSVAAN